MLVAVDSSSSALHPLIVISWVNSNRRLPMKKALDHDFHGQTAWRMIGHLPEMAQPQHAKRPMSTPKTISKPVAQKILAGEPVQDKVTEPARVQHIPQHASAAAKAVDVIVRGTVRPVHCYCQPQGNFDKEEAGRTLMAYCGEEQAADVMFKLPEEGCCGRPTELKTGSSAAPFFR